VYRLRLFAMNYLYHEWWVQSLATCPVLRDHFNELGISMRATALFYCNVDDNSLC
jgi:hypothetical protein